MHTHTITHSKTHISARTHTQTHTHTALWGLTVLKLYGKQSLSVRLPLCLPAVGSGGHVIVAVLG